MMKPVCFILLAVIGYSGAAAQSAWKGFTYTAPAGFKIADNQERLFLEKKASGKYCQLFIYPAENTAAGAEECFSKQWDFFARNEQQGIAAPETEETDSSNGWVIKFGAARGKYNGKQFVLTLSSRYKQGVTYFVATVINDKQFLAAAEVFTNSVAITSEGLAVVQNNFAAINNETVAGNPGKIYTEFADGWVSTYIFPYVQVAKDNIKALVFPVKDSLDNIQRNPDEYFEEKYWRYITSNFFEAGHTALRPWQMSGTGSDNIYEAEAKNRLTGEQGFIAMKVVCNSGRCQPVVAFAASKEILYKSVFARYNSFDQVLPYNKFMPTAALLQGNWKSYEKGATGSYTVGGGFQGGKAKVGFKDGFTFKTDGSYESMHGVSYRPELGDGYVQKYAGRYTLIGNTVQLTNWRKDDPGAFDCWLEAADGGLALKLVNKKFTGQRYTLLKE